MNPFSELILHRRLVLDLTRRDIHARYRGTLLGVAWALITPLFMLVLYTTFFSVVLKAKWGVGNTEANYGLMLFCGLMVHGWMAEVLAKSSDLLVANRNYVKKVVFPLEILPWITVFSALSQFLFSWVILACLTLYLGNGLAWTAMLTPLLMMPLLLMLTGISWFFASLSVYLRDLGQVMGAFLTFLLFSSTAFFSLETAPAFLRQFILFNPLTIPMESLRDVTIMHTLPDWNLVMWHALASIVVFAAGYAWFKKTRAGFADVL